MIKSIIIHMELVDPNDISKGLRQLGEYELEYEDAITTGKTNRWERNHANLG